MFVCSIQICRCSCNNNYSVWLILYLMPLLTSISIHYCKEGLLYILSRFWIVVTLFRISFYHTNVKTSKRKQIYVWKGLISSFMKHDSCMDYIILVHFILYTRKSVFIKLIYFNTQIPRTLKKCQFFFRFDIIKRKIISRKMPIYRLYFPSVLIVIMCLKRS